MNVILLNIIFLLCLFFFKVGNGRCLFCDLYDFEFLFNVIGYIGYYVIGVEIFEDFFEIFEVFVGMIGNDVEVLRG